MEHQCPAQVALAASKCQSVPLLSHTNQTLLDDRLLYFNILQVLSDVWEKPWPHFLESLTSSTGPWSVNRGHDIKMASLVEPRSQRDLININTVFTRPTVPCLAFRGFCRTRHTWHCGLAREFFLVTPSFDRIMWTSSLARWRCLTRWYLYVYGDTGVVTVKELAIFSGSLRLTQSQWDGSTTYVFMRDTRPPMLRDDTVTSTNWPERESNSGRPTWQVTTLPPRLLHHSSAIKLVLLLP